MSSSPLTSLSRTPAHDASLVGMILMPYFSSNFITEAITTEAQSVKGMKPMRTSFFSGASEPAAQAAVLTVEPAAAPAARAADPLMKVLRSSLIKPSRVVMTAPEKTKQKGVSTEPAEHIARWLQVGRLCPNVPWAPHAVAQDHRAITCRSRARLLARGRTYEVALARRRGRTSAMSARASTWCGAPSLGAWRGPAFSRADAAGRALRRCVRPPAPAAGRGPWPACGCGGRPVLRSGRRRPSGCPWRAR